ncbi:glycoside hydrolase family 18 protein [Candidatus Peregrinibacteria bacterium]|nr:MAG: glycoside hydrolase family 18 protein [Candidatus Peregrinibacteria bacterium]
MFKTTQKTLRLLILLFVLFFSIFSFMVIWFWFGIHVEKDHEPALAFWLPHEFSTGQQNSQTLLEKFQGLPVTDLYFHVGPIEPDGTLAKDLSLSAEDLAALPSTNYAWIGQIRSKVPLENAAVRQKIIDSCQWLLMQGFDGIHLDIEPVREDDSDFLLLLQEMRSALPTASISIAMDEWQPHGFTQLLAKHFEVPMESYWSTEQVESVLPYVDQLVVMTYDTGFRDPDLYSWWVEQQTLALSKRVGSDTELFIGIPCYNRGTRFDPLAENVQSSLKGYLRGVQNLRTQTEHVTGLAVYPYWEMDETEWTSLHQFFSPHETDLPE